MTKPARFTKSDVARAMGGARQSGFTRVRVAIDLRGNLVIDASDDSIELEPPRRNPLDRLLPPPS